MAYCAAAGCVWTCGCAHPPPPPAHTARPLIGGNQQEERSCCAILQVQTDTTLSLSPHTCSRRTRRQTTEHTAFAFLSPSSELRRNRDNSADVVAAL